MADGSTPRRGAIDDRLVKALAHPLRRRILGLLNEEVSSPREIAEALGEKLGDVGYHVRMLHRYGAIELVRTEQRRGAIKHFYRATARNWLTEAQLTELPASVRRSAAGDVLSELWRHVGDALDGGGFDGTDIHASYTKLDLDEEGHAAVTALLDETLERALAIQAEVAGRRVARAAEGGADEDDEVRSEIGLLHFRRPPIQ